LIGSHGEIRNYKTSDIDISVSGIDSKKFSFTPRTRSTSKKTKILAIITDCEDVRKILKHLIRIGKQPPGLDSS